ncbi:MAG: PhoX family phosphatase [Acidobacteria bacterium]|nr:PhoX family phosphatase [Acidobacteriota bacterium]
MKTTRRRFLYAPLLLAGPRALAQQASSGLTFRGLEHNREPGFVVPEGYRLNLVIGWGDPLTAGAPSFDVNAQNGAAQSVQFGYNCDHLGYFPLPSGSDNSSRGLLVVNHESSGTGLMFFSYVTATPTRDQVDAGLASVGLSVVEVERTPNGWVYVQGSQFNRRVTGETVIEISGPAAGADWMKTSYDPAGTRVRGSWTNCAGGKTPWGTALSGEEGFTGYFGNLSQLPPGELRDLHTRYGMTAGATGRRWENYYSRFDIPREPNEGFRFGWVVELDPYDPSSPPKKRTALGRVKHEGAACRVAQDGRVAVYTGDDQAFERVYKFVTSRPWNPNNRAANRDLLDEGTLYVARFNEDGTGDWLPLIWGYGPLAPSRGFRNQADVLIHARLAADALGATRMDRPEDIEANPVTGKVYINCTSNTGRTASGPNGTDRANPRANNRHGHIIELVEAGDNSAATEFRWSIFMLCGKPNVREDQPTYYGGYDMSKVTPISTPDNLAFDNLGNMWIATDGMRSTGTFGVNDAVVACPVEGPERGYARMFCSVPPGAEPTGPEFTPDNETLFVSVQHPGEGGTLGGTVVSNWPGNSEPPRASVVAITKAAGAGERRIGS